MGILPAVLQGPDEGELLLLEDLVLGPTLRRDSFTSFIILRAHVGTEEAVQRKRRSLRSQGAEQFHSPGNGHSLHPHVAEREARPREAVHLPKNLASCQGHNQA